MSLIQKVMLCLGICILALQLRLWFGDGSIRDVFTLKKEVSVAHRQVKKLQSRNQMLEAEVQDLKQRLEALEERARTDLGMIQKGETFFQVEKPAAPKAH